MNMELTTREALELYEALSSAYNPSGDETAKAANLAIRAKIKAWFEEKMPGMTLR